MSESIKTPGLLLQSIPYLGQKKILKILTSEHGLISLFVQKTSLSPFCHAEWVYLKSTREIHTLQDSTLLDPLLELRTDYAILSAAGSIAQDLLRTQMPGKKGPLSLALAYLKKLPLNPPILAASFRLRLLLHEGLFSPEPDPTFTPPEWEQVSTLAFCRHFSEISEQKTAPFSKIATLFDQRLA
jgi:recombinational DNA repair protein (RecF pathway)